MNRQHRQRLQRAIGTTILGCAALLVATANPAKAATLSYTFEVEQGRVSGFFKLNNSSLTGIGSEEIAVSEGKLNGLTATFKDFYGLQGKEYYDLAGAKAVFERGEFQGLIARGSDSSTREINIPPEVEGGPFYTRYNGSAAWYMAINGGPLFWGYKEVLITYSSGGQLLQQMDRGAGPRFDYVPITYTLVDTAAEPVPEPITIAGTALAIAGLSWLRQKKKQAI
ncbi:MAG: PEP-CTERM sorting domain-containing protein [Microcoleus sp.]